MKKILLLVLCLVCFGCSNNNSKEKINEFVKQNSANAIIEKLDKDIQNISMFPEETKENEFIYLVLAIKDNINKFNQDELNTIYNKLNISYRFSFNSLNYTNEDYQTDINFIASKINN